ncbi:putative mynd finger family protein [Diaporthe ampelina]|uniref:Putative mynd finger family protein n=1 Tax=Diaporthe ampelina TaxID=1214573 RepID=A0A0G2FEC9_9PEZI|nr:putative mynd finger family protein [Diaporthe ampelina]
MLAPTVLDVFLPFHAIGNTPAVALTRNVPQGVDADILLLGAGDVRHILYTAYHERGLPRNLFFLTLLVTRGKELKHQLFWNVYYHLFLDEESAQVLQAHLVLLMAASNSLKDWRESKFSSQFRFGTASTLFSVRRVWDVYAQSLARKDQNQYRADFDTALKHSKSYRDATVNGEGAVYIGARAAAPFGVQALASEGMKIAIDSWWEKGTTGLVPVDTYIPNPLFAATLSKHSVLQYGANPVISYHLATAYAHVTERSPLRTNNSSEEGSSLAVVAAAQAQFAEWSKAFIETASGDMKLRFFAADALSLCHTLQHHLGTGQMSGHFYRRQLTMERLELDPDEYGMQYKTPKQFDIVDTSTLSDTLGILNILVSGSPLLKAAPWATLYTETMDEKTEGKEAKFDEILCGPARTVATLLGISPVEYWTNSTAVSNVDEYMLAVSANQSASDQAAIQWRLAWKCHEHLSGQTGQQLQLKVKDDALVNLIHKAYLAMFAGEALSDRQSEEFIVAIDEDLAAWLGDSDIIATFSVPVAALGLATRYIKVSLCLHNATLPASLLSRKIPELETPTNSEPIIIYETDLEDSAHVYLTKNKPGQDGLPLYSNLGPTGTKEATEDHKSCFAADIDFSGVLTTITGRLDISSQNGKKLLAEKAPVDVRKISPFIFEIVLGNRDEVYPLCFPVPVVKDGSKTRIARTSAYVEVTAPIADPTAAQTLDDFIFPSTLAKSRSSPSIGQTIPVPLNVPHVNLDNLPVLDIADKERLGFLTTLTSCMFSARERKLRDQASDSGLVTSARMNFKESLFTMFMLASGLQGGQTGLFAIHHPEKGGIHMLLFVSAIRLDGANASVALDAAVIPFTVEMIQGGKLEPFLLILRELECCTITVDDEELALWKKVLPALAERCRNWTHTPECEYAVPGAAVPLSTEAGKQVLCSCGAGRLPQDFISLPEWDVAAQFATRIAISPTYAVAFVEDVIDPSMAENIPRSGLGVQGYDSLRCTNCGGLEAKGGGALMKCARCKTVRYCSAECQKKDWKKHRMECGKAGEKRGN